MVRRQGHADVLGESLVTIQDCRKVGFCTAGTREWFNSHGLDFRDFVRNGIPVETLAAFDDGLANKVLEGKARG